MGEEARKRLLTSTHKAHENAYGSSTIYGRKLLAQNVERIAKRMDERLLYLRRGRAAVDGELVATHLKNADTKVLAVLAMKVALDVLGSDKKPKFVALCRRVGEAIEIELRLNWYMSQDQEIYKKIENHFHNSTGTRQKVTVFRKFFNEAGHRWTAWGSVTNFKIGAWAMDALMYETGWLTRSVERHSRTKTIDIIRYSQEFLGLRDSIMDRAMTLAYCLWPMLCEPVPWSNEDRGGFLTEEIRQTGPMVRAVGQQSLGDLSQGSIPIQFLNNLQAQKYRINTDVLEVAQWCYDNFRTVGKFVRDDVLPPPPRPAEDASEEEVKEYKSERRKREDLNAQLSQRNYRTTDVMFTANLYKHEACFWIPWSFDYRGRVYPLLTSLSPQGTDFDKSLLYFVDEGPVDEWWLAWHLATTAGEDKASNEERVQWTRSRTELITAIARNPYSNTQWMDADEPWSHLAAIFEYYECCIAKTKTTSGLPCGIDATMSGLQHLSAATLDREAGELVNLTPGDRKADGYKAVADEAIKHLSEDPELIPFIDRKTVKRVCMTYFYSLSRDKARDYLKAALKEKEPTLTHVRGRVPRLVDAVYKKAVPAVFSGPCDFMDWVQSCVPGLLERGDVIRWKTPSGFNVRQNVRHSLTDRIKTRVMGTVIQTSVGSGWGKPNKAKHISSVSPNVVHSWDASLLHLAFAYFDKPFTCIHDCVLGRSCDMEELNHVIRQEFVEMYKGDPLQDLADQWGVLIPDGLMKNTLDIELVNSSKYFFC